MNYQHITLDNGLYAVLIASRIDLYLNPNWQALRTLGQYPEMTCKFLIKWLQTMYSYENKFNLGSLNFDHTYCRCRWALKKWHRQNIRHKSTVSLVVLSYAGWFLKRVTSPEWMAVLRLDCIWRVAKNARYA